MHTVEESKDSIKAHLANAVDIEKSEKLVAVLEFGRGQFRL